MRPISGDFRECKLFARFKHAVLGEEFVECLLADRGFAKCGVHLPIPFHRRTIARISEIGKHPTLNPVYPELVEGLHFSSCVTPGVKNKDSPSTSSG